MAKISYVNGEYTLHRDASVHIEDRAYQFADGVYEVVLLQNGIMIDGKQHFERLERSLKGLRIDTPLSTSSLKIIIKELTRRNRCKDAMVYIQISRGVAKRDHAFPTKTVPSVVITLSPFKLPDSSKTTKGKETITTPDIRWKRADIKSVSLLPNILAKQQAVEANCIEAILVNDKGEITEGSSTNVFMVNGKGTIITHPTTEQILGGITRSTLVKLARDNGITVEERAFTVDEAINAKELFITSTTKGAYPISAIDGKTINNGMVGEVVKKLQILYKDYINQQITAVA